MMSKRYIVIYDLSAGVANIGNVFVVSAEDEAGAISEVMRQARVNKTARHHFRAYALEDLPTFWSYFV